ncbi:MAG TPA: hypothetical protein VNA16_04785, partial [Abditibacteriaceae bacterium]|nr:hypothetical protein [Abditibacteriaceae bacterium]
MRFGYLAAVPTLLVVLAPLSAAEPVTAPTPLSGQPLAPATPSVPSVGSTVTTPTTTISTVDGQTITINAGSTQGVRAGTNLPILRGGTIIGLIKVETAGTDSSTGTIIWREETATPIAAGDIVGVLPGAVTVSVASDGAPAAPVRFETGLSNEVVPRAHHAYVYLAALAAAGLITRYPAHLFHDNGTRFHNTDEDITFTRSQIAGLVREAMNSPKAQSASLRERAALDMLFREFWPELPPSYPPGTTPERPTYAAGNGFQIGFSGQTRASVVAGDTDDVIDPYYDRNGSRRSKSGIDSRLNLFGQVNNSLRFLATVDSSSDVHESDDSRRVKVRRALLSYDANKLLRGLSVDLGRDELWWGPGHFGTLLLGDTAGPLNMIKTTFKRGSYQLEGLYSPLGNGPGGGGGRSLYGHNFQVKIGKQSRIGFAETVLLPQDKFDPVLFAAANLPIPLFLVERVRHENNSLEEGNILTEFYYETSLARGLQAYGELLIDDIGVNANNLVRNRIGTLIGGHLFTPRDPGKLGLYAEYGTLAGRTYLEFNAAGFGNKDYYYRNRPLGYPVAPLPNAAGATGLRLDAYWRATPRLRLGIGADLADLGAEEGLGVAGAVASRQQTLRLRAAYDLSRRLTLIGRAQHVATSRPNF